MISDATVALAQIDATRREFATHLWQHIPRDGSPIGNSTLRRLTKTTTNDSYRATRDALVAAGLIELGGGRGGSVKRTELYRVDSPAPSAAATHGLELALYPTIVKCLDELLRDEVRFDEHIIAETGKQGRRDTGGKWTRPDITVIGLRKFLVLAGAYLEVNTYEIKTAAGFDVVALHEARAHRRHAHRAYVLVDLENAADESSVADLVPVARDLGVGLVSFMSPTDAWNTWYEPELVLPETAPRRVVGFQA